MKYILLDLDGTVTDPKLGITKSVQYALKALGIQEENLDSLCKFIGPPLRDSFREYYGYDAAKAEEAVAKYREYFAETGLYENEVFEGMEAVLARLKEAGKVLIIATSKPEVFARRILEHFGLDGYFTDICGAELDGRRSVKEEVIRYALERNQITDYSEVVMVGDRKHDLIGAKAVGLACIGVLYGYGDREEHEKAGADWIAETIEDVYNIIMSL